MFYCIDDGQKNMYWLKKNWYLYSIKSKNEVFWIITGGWQDVQLTLTQRCLSKTTAVHRFLFPDCEARSWYCKQFQELVFNGLLHLELRSTFCSDKAWFTSSGYVNRQNNRHLGTENPHIVHEVPLHDLKLGSGMPLFLHITNSKCYVRLIMWPFFNQLTDEEKPYSILCKIMLWHTLQTILWMHQMTSSENVS
jgi:hypothetical protein